MTLYKTSKVKGHPEVIAEKTVEGGTKCRICDKDIDETMMIEGCGRKECPFGNRKENNDKN